MITCLIQQLILKIINKRDIQGFKISMEILTKILKILSIASIVNLTINMQMNLKIETL